MSKEAITIEDCIDMFEKKGKTAIIQHGEVITFIKEDKLDGKRCS